MQHSSANLAPGSDDWGGRGRWGLGGFTGVFGAYLLGMGTCYFLPQADPRGSEVGISARSSARLLRQRWAGWGCAMLFRHLGRGRTRDEQIPFWGVQQF